MDIPVKSAVLKGSELTLDVEAVRGSNKGTVNSSGSTTDCTWARGAIVPARLPKCALRSFSVCETSVGPSRFPEDATGEQSAACWSRPGDSHLCALGEL